MINNNFCKLNGSLNKLSGKTSSMLHLHIARKPNALPTRPLTSLFLRTCYQFASSGPASQQASSQQAQINYNSFRTIRELHNLPHIQNKFPPSPTSPPTFLSHHYPTISLDLQKKLQKVQSILHSPQKNLYKIVQEIIIVLEAFAQVNRRDVMEENVIKVVKEFGSKIVGAYLENLQVEELEESERKSTRKGGDDEPGEENDADYLLHENYTTPPPQMAEKEYMEQPTSQIGTAIDMNFIFFYIQTIKSWLLARIETDSIIRQAEQEMYNIFNFREVSALSDTLKSTLNNLITNYIEEPSLKKREMFPFDVKLRGMCLLPFFENKKHMELYLHRLAEENLLIYLKESQIINLMYDVTELKPDLTNNTQFVYQIQSTQIYQTLSTLNGAYIKALFINYTRRFMVSYQQIQFYQLFRDIQSKIKYPTIRTFIRFTQILQTEADDLHCEYNKIMNKYNYNIIISIISSQSYNVENTRFEEFMELYEGLNRLEKSGEVLYEEMGKFIRAHSVREGGNLKPEHLERLYRLFLHVLDQAKPIFKFEDKEGLNREYGRKTTILLTVLFDMLMEKYPHVVVIGSRSLKSYLIADENVSSSIAVLPYDDRDLKMEIGHSENIQTKLNKVRTAFTKVIKEAEVFTMSNPNPQLPYTLHQLLQSSATFLRTTITWVRREDLSYTEPDTSSLSQKPLIVKQPSEWKIFGNIHPPCDQLPIQQSFFRATLEPLLKQYLQLANKDLIKKLSNKQFQQLYRHLYMVLSAMNLIEYRKEVVEQVEKYADSLKRKVLYEMKVRLDQKEKGDQLARLNGIEKLTMALPKGNVELLLCLNELIRLSAKVSGGVSQAENGFSQMGKTEQHLSSTSAITQGPSPAIKSLYPSLPLIYNFINKLAIQNFKAIEEPDIINMLIFIKSVEEIKASQKDKVLLLEMNIAVYEYLYQAMSLFVMYLADRGKMYLKLTASNAEPLMSVVSHFVANKNTFRQLPSKKRLVVLQAILVGLVRRKFIKISMTHLKRSEHAKIILTFLEIFEYPENLTVDLRRIVEEAEFLTSDLEEVDSQVLERFSDVNWTISRYLDDINVNLTSSKKLIKLTVEELRKEFEQGKSGKIYEMILKNSKYQLPFELPEPRVDDLNAKMVYIIEKIYQKISKKNNYAVPKSGRSSRASKRHINFKKHSMLQEQSFEQPDSFMVQQHSRSDEPLFDKKEDDSYAQESMLQSQTSAQPFSTSNFKDINLEEQKFYIKKESLVNYTYEDHYKMTNNQLPLHFKKEHWKNIYSVAKDLEIQSLDIDENIDQNIYKQVLLALLGYVEKVKMVAKKFHSHSFIQYVAAQLDMQVFYHGCIARIARKNKPQENVLFVCAQQTNYKLLYICTHILRESGQNAFIVMDRTKDSDFKEFLEKLLPQPFEAEESEIVDKVVKGEIEVDGEGREEV